MARREECIPRWLWHAFDALDNEKNGTAPKTELKVLTAHIGNSLGAVNSNAVAKELIKKFDDSPCIGFNAYRIFLRDQKFLVLEDIDLVKLEEVTWLICGSRYEDRTGKKVLDQGEVYKLWRIFNFFAEPGVFPAVLDPQEATIMFEKLVVAMGTKWSSEDFLSKMASMMKDLRFTTCLQFFEQHYAGHVVKMCVRQGISEVYNSMIEELEKMGQLKKKGHKVTNWKDRWFVLKPGSLAYFVDKTLKEQKGDIPITTKWKVEILPDQKGYKNLFVLYSGDTTESQAKVKTRYELSASDPRTRQEWITSIEMVLKRMESGESPHVQSLEKRRAERRQRKEEAEEVERLRQLQMAENERQRLRLAEMEKARDEAVGKAREEYELRLAKEREEEENRRREMEDAAKKQAEKQAEIDALKAARDEAARKAEEEYALRLAKEREEEENRRREMEDTAKKQAEIDALKASRDEAARKAQEELTLRMAKEEEERENKRREEEEREKTQQEIEGLRAARDEAARKAQEELTLRMAKEEEEKENKRREEKEREETQQEIEGLRAARERAESRAEEEAEKFAAREKEEEERRRLDEEEKERQARELEELKKAYEDATKRAEIEERLKEEEMKRMAELEESLQQLELLLDEERQAKRDEEIVRAVQSRILCEETEKREQLEKLREEQDALLRQEQEKREHLEHWSEELVQQRLEQARQLEEEREKLRELEEDRKAADEKLKAAMDKLSQAAEAKKQQERKRRELEKPVGLARLIQPRANPLITHRGMGAFTETQFALEKERRQLQVKGEEAPQNATANGDILDDSHVIKVNGVNGVTEISPECEK